MTIEEIEELESRFTYHAPNEDQIERYDLFRKMALNFALIVLRFCPESREKSLAMTKIDEAVMWANAAIARNENG